LPAVALPPPEIKMVMGLSATFTDAKQAAGRRVVEVLLVITRPFRTD
jgi:hypothetical protein